MSFRQPPVADDRGAEASFISGTYNDRKERAARCPAGTTAAY